MSSLLPRPFRRTTGSFSGGSAIGGGGSAPNGSSDLPGTSAVSFPPPVGGSKASFLSAPSAASGTGTSAESSIATASTASASSTSPISPPDGRMPLPPGSASKYRRGYTNGRHPAQHVPAAAAAAMTTANPATPTAVAAAEGPLGINAASNSGGGARSGLRRYLNSVPTYQQAAASMMPRKKNSSGSLMAEEESASFGSGHGGSGGGGQYGGVVLPRLANLASVPTASSVPDHPSASARFYNPWRRSTSGRSNGGGARMRRGTGRMMVMSSSSSSSFGAQRGIGGWVASGGSRSSRRRIVLPALVLLLVGWYAMGSGIGGGDGTNVSTFRSDDNVALTHNATLATSLVGMRTKRQSGDDHDSSDEGAVVTTVAKTRR